MPTSGESGIGPSSTYNLRRRPLPKATSRPNTRSSNKKENVAGTRRAAPSTRLTKKTEQSKIPVPNSKIPVPRSTRSTAVKKSSALSTPTRRKVPDFEKLHKSWNKKFQQGKAVTKKPCTQTEAFDLTRPGTHFKSAYYDGTKKDVRTRRQTGFAFTADDEFEVDNGALNDILDGKGLEEEGKEHKTMPSRATLAGTGVSSGFASSGIVGRRQTLGQLPSMGAGRVNNASNVSTVREMDKGVIHHGKKSLVQEQKDAGIMFEESADALASILNNTGLQASENHHNIIGGRQTIAGMSAKQRQSGRFNVTTGRTSIYYQKPKNHDVNKVYSEFAKRTLSRFTMDGNQASFKTAFIDSLLPDNRGSLYIKPGLPSSEKPAASMSNATSSTSSTSSVVKNLRAITPARVPVTDRSKSAAAIGRTPGTAARVPNPHFNEARTRQEQSCSPALTPARRIPTTPGGQSQKNVRWADVLSSPTEGDHADHMATKDVVAVLNFGDDAVSPETQTRFHEVEKLEAETVANRQKLNEMEEIEKQLELEIARLHEAGDVEELETSEQPASHPAPAMPHTSTNQHATEPHASTMLDHVPIKQPANYVDPVKLPKKDKMETVNIRAPAPAPAKHGYGNMSNMEFHQHVPREVQHFQDRFQSGQNHMQAADLEREFGHQHGDRSVPVEMNSVNATSARSIDMMKQESSSLYVPYVSQDVYRVSDKLSTVQPVNMNNGVRQTSESSQWLRSPSGMERFETGPPELMVSDSTEAFQGVFPTFLQNSCQSSRHPEAQGLPTAIAGQETAQGHTVLLTSSAIKPGVQDFVNSRSVGSGQYVNAHTIHHSVVEEETRNSLLFSAHDSNRTMVTNNPHIRGTDPQSSFLTTSAASSKQHIHHSTQETFNVPTKTIPPMEDPRLTIHTPQPVRSRRGGTSFLKPTPDLRSISTPLHHSSVMPTPIQTPLSMRNASFALSSGRVHQQWPSPVVAPNAPSFQSYVQSAGHRAVSNTLNTASLQQQSLSQPTPSNSFGLASTAGPAYSSVHPVRGPIQSRLDQPTNGMATAFQYTRPRTASALSERPRMNPSQGQNSGVTRSLSLSDNLMGNCSRERVLPLNQQIENEREASGQLFHQVLLDEECALYACRLKGRYTPQSVEARPINPIAKVLLHGDDMHFVPIRDVEFLVSSPSGSAFSNYYTTT